VANTRAIALIILVLACAVRLFVVVPRTDVPVKSVDQSEYLALGQNLRQHGVFSYGMPHRWGDRGTIDAPGPYEPSAARAPLYPLAIALLWQGAGPPVQAIRIGQAVLGGFVALFVYLIALRAFGARTALVAGAAMAVAPLSIYLTTLLLTETLFSFLLTAGLWAWGRQQGILAGILIGAATLTRAVALPFVAVIALMAIVLRFNRGLHARIALAAVLVIAPWTIRNVVTQQAFIPVASMGWGANILVGTIDVPYGASDLWERVHADPAFTAIIETSRTEREAEGKMMAEGLRRIREAPVDWLMVRLKQYPRLFLGAPHYLYDSVPLPPSLVKAVFLLGNLVFVALAAWGLLTSGSRWRETYPLALFVVLLAVLQFPALTEQRYSLGMVPVMVVFAAHAIVGLSMSLSSRRRPA